MNIQDKVVYQIYPKSFCDGNGDGIGDITGIISKLDYLQELGVDYLWLTPVYPSPQRDNGYDVADYCAIDPVYGTMSDFEELVRQADSRSMGIMMDMVFNHTSTAHRWFQKAIEGDPVYENYYIFKEGKDGLPPTDWASKFGGSAWKYVPEKGRWYLHLFDETQADLNWENPQVRKELKDVLRFWKTKGVAGFRFDVVNLISKPDVFCDDPTGDGRRFYTDGPRVHAYIKEMAADAHLTDMMTVGEMSSTTIENCILYSSPKEKELSMTFSFHHLKVDYPDGRKWELAPCDHRQLHGLFEKWQEKMQDGGGWNALFWCNHDQPRSVSRFGDDRTQKMHALSAKALALLLHMMRGTPYIYQGEEIGMTNPGFTQIGQYRDVESMNYFKILQEEGKSAAQAMDVIKERSRDNGRTPMQWDETEFAGFTTGTPWIDVAGNYREINVRRQACDRNSILSFYRELIRLRKKEKAIAGGTIRFLPTEDPHIYVYERNWQDDCLQVFVNLSGQERDVTAGGREVYVARERAVLSNYPKDAHGAEKAGGIGTESKMGYTLRPFEALVIK